MAKDKDLLNPDEELDLSGGSAGKDSGDSMVLDLNDVDEEGPGFEAMPPGVYNCIVENAEFGPSSKGNPMITWVFKVIDPQYEGRLLFNHTTLNNDVGKSRLKRLLARVVPDVDMGAFNPAAFCDGGEALGLPCRVKVRIKAYQGQKRNDVTDVLPPAEGSSFMDDE